MDNWTDNSVCGYNWPESRNIIQQASYGPSTISFGLVELDWKILYDNIRKTNVFIKNVTASAELTDSYKKLRIAEARFLRAYFYHRLWMAYGGVPLIDEVLIAADQGDDIFVERSSSGRNHEFYYDRTW